MKFNKKLTIEASGKINLYLNVQKNDRTDGYHEIKSIMQSVSLSDELCFEVFHKGYGVASHSENGNDIFITSNDVEIPLGEKNLVHKAALLILNNFNLRKKYNIKINIHKRIPVSAGLAGGSTNAAATLVALQKLFNLNIGKSELIEMADSVGSDVPFCIYGGTALVEGKGEKISVLPDLPFYWVVLASNGKKFLSGEVYEKFDLIGKEKKSIHDDLINNIFDRKFTDFLNNLGNDLEDVVVTEDSIVASLKEKALSLGAISAQMTGSGPTVFAFCRDLKVAREVHKGLEELSSRVFLSYTIPNSLNFI